jgi:inosose dehydratase
VAIRYAVSPIAWINDDMPELGAGTPLTRILADARSIGFQGVELGGSFPRTAPDLSALLAPFDLSLAGGWFGGRLLERGLAAEIAAARGHIALLRAMGCPVFIYAETSRAVHGERRTPLASRPRLVEDDRRRLGEALTDFAAFLAGEGLALAYHPHLGTVVEDADDIRVLLDGCGPAVGLTLDTGHLALAEIDAASLVRDHPSRIIHVHAKDVRAGVFDRVRRDRMSFLDGVLEGMFTVPGDGDLDWGVLMRALASIGYEGWIVVEAEQDPAKAEPATHAAMGLATLRAAAREAGIEEERER